MGRSICLLAMLKLMNIQDFVVSFKKYDLISSRFSKWVFIYPFCELLIGLSFLLPALPSSITLIAFILGIFRMTTLFQSV